MRGSSARSVRNPRGDMEGGVDDNARRFSYAASCVPKCVWSWRPAGSRAHLAQRVPEVLHAMVHPRPPARLELPRRRVTTWRRRPRRPPPRERARRLARAQRLRPHGREHHRGFGHRGRVLSPRERLQRAAVAPLGVARIALPPRERRGEVGVMERRAPARDLLAERRDVRRREALDVGAEAPLRLRREVPGERLRRTAQPTRDVLPADRPAEIVRVLLREPGRAREPAAHGVAREQTRGEASVSRPRLADGAGGVPRGSPRTRRGDEAFRAPVVGLMTSLLHAPLVGYARARSARARRKTKAVFLVLSSCLPNADSGAQSAGRCDVSIAIMR